VNKKKKKTQRDASCPRPHDRHYSSISNGRSPQYLEATAWHSLAFIKARERTKNRGGAPSTGRRRRKRGGKTGEKPEESVTIVLAISSTGERDRQTQEGD
jgi:hypothetical protein